MSATPEPKPQPQSQIKLSSPKLDELDHRLWAAFAKSERVTREAEPAITKLKKTVIEQQVPKPDTGKLQRPTIYLDQQKFEQVMSDSDKHQLSQPLGALPDQTPPAGVEKSAPG